MPKATQVISRVPGGARFGFENGAQRTLVGPEAESLAAQLEAAGNKTVSALSGPAALVAPSDEANARALRVAPTMGSIAERPVASPTYAQQVALAGDIKRPAVEQPTVPAQPELRGMIQTHPAGDPEGLNRLVRPYYDAAIAKDARDTAIAARSTALDVKEAEAGIQNALEMSQVHKKMLADDEAHRAAIAKRRDDDVAEYSRLNKELLTEEIDPRRAEKQGKLGGVETLIGVALGSIASGLTGRPNIAIDAVNKRIEADIESQKRAYQLKKEHANNLFARAQAATGDLEQARNVTRALMLGQAEQAARERLARLGPERAKVNGDAVLSELAAKREGAELAILERSRALAPKPVDPLAAAKYKVALRNAELVLDGKLTLEDQAKRDADRQDAEKERESRENIAGIKARASGDVDRTKLRAEYGTKLSALSDALTGFERYGSEMGLVPNPKTGQLEMKEGQTELPDVGWNAQAIANKAMPTEAARRIEQARANAVDLLGRARSGGAISQDEFETFQKILSGRWGTEAEAINGINMVYSAIQRKMSSLQAGYGKDIVDDYNAQDAKIRAGKPEKPRGL